MPQPSKDLDPTRSPQDWFGAHLRHWRMVRRKTQRELAHEVHVSASTIAKIEKAERPCDLPLARSLDDALDTGGILAWLCLRTGTDADNAPGDADSPAVPLVPSGLPGFPAAMLPVAEGTTGDGSHVDRRTFLGATGAAALLVGTPLSHLIKPAEPSRLPSVVRPEDIEQVEAAATVLAGWDHHYGGGGIVRTAAEAQLRWASALLELPCPDTLRAASSPPLPDSAWSWARRTSMRTPTRTPAVSSPSQPPAPKRQVSGTCEPRSTRTEPVRPSGSGTAMQA